MQCEFWFDFASTYSYPTAMRIEALAQQAGVTVVWRPFLLGPIFHAQGWNDSPFNIYPVKGQYMWRDMERICAAQGLPLVRPSKFPQHSVLAARVACVGDGQAWQAPFVKAVYHANFAQGLDISSPEVLSACLQAVGQDAASVLAAAQSPENKERLKLQTERAMQLGVFGAPTFTVTDARGTEVFWGNDRLETALAWARG